MGDNVTSMPAPSFLPATAALEMTYQCNHRCLFCSCPWEATGNGYRKGRELGTEEWKGALSLLANMGVVSFAFTGGEPLLRKDIWEIIGHAAALKAENIETRDGSLESTMITPRLYLISNGTLVDEAVLEKCARYNVSLSMSLPGLETYRRHTGRGSPSHILGMFGRAAAMGIQTTVNIAVTRLNIGELYETIGSALVAGAQSLLINRFLPGGRGLRNARLLSLSAEQVNDMLDTAEKVLREGNRRGSVGTELPRCILRRNDYTHLKVSTRCSAAKDFFVVGPSGRLRSCNHSPVELEGVDNIEEVKRNPYWKTFVHGDYRPAMCGECSMMFDCDGGCREAAHIVHGGVDSPDMLFDGRAAPPALD